jgi:hypothetical protein
MARCPNGHEQRLGLRCALCNAELSYRSSVNDLRLLPKVTPDYGHIAILTVGYRGLSLAADYIGEISSGDTDAKTSTNFQVANIRGGSWLDLQKKYQDDLRRWIALVGVDKSTDKFLVVNTTNPLSVLALSSLPKLEHTAVIAVAADQDSTPVEQNTSYVAISLALKRGLPVVALSDTFEKEMLYFTENRGFVARADAMSRLLQTLLGAADDLMDLLEKDRRLGIKLHCLSAVVAGSKTVFGVVTNAFTAQAYNASIGAKPEGYQTVHSLVFSDEESRPEFEKSFGVYRNRKFKGAISAELRFHENGSQLYDMITIYGLKDEAFLETIAHGYQAIVGSLPELNAEGVS